MKYVPPKIAVGIPTWGKVSIKWAEARAHLEFMLGSSAVDIYIENEKIADARNIIVKRALEVGAEYIFFLGDDVIAPPNSILQLLSRNVDMVTGIYWTKGFPTHPYIWRGMQRGPFLDWKAGEFFKIDFAGVDCTLIRTDVFRKVEYPWFSTDWLWNEDQEKPSAIATEDFYFYLKAKKAGFDLWADTSVQCLHEDRNSGIYFGLDTSMPQAGMASTGKYKGKRIADIGCGKDNPFFDNECDIVRLDIDEKNLPTIRCDVRQIPQPNESFDVVYSQHVLEHFGRFEVPTVLKEWIRILKVGGELLLSVPNVKVAMKNILDGKSTHYEWWMLYGAQDDKWDFHGTGFVKGTLEKLLKMNGCLDQIEVVEKDYNLEAKAIKVKSEPREIILDWFADTHPGSTDFVEKDSNPITSNTAGEMTVQDVLPNIVEG